MPRRSTVCRVTLSTGHAQDEPTLDAAKGAARVLLLHEPPGTRARVEREDIETRHYEVDDEGLVHRVGPPPHPGGRPPLPPEERRQLVAARLHPRAIERLDTYCAATGATRTQAIERAIEALLGSSTTCDRCERRFPIPDDLATAAAIRAIGSGEPTAVWCPACGQQHAIKLAS